MRVLDWVPSVILVPAVTSEMLAMVPGFKLQIANRATSVKIAYSHCALVSLVVNRLGTQHMLLLLSKAFKNVVWANFHDVDLLLEAFVLTLFSNASLIGANFSETTTRNHRWLHAHERSVTHGLVLATTTGRTERLLLAVWVPVIVSLVQPVKLLE